MFFTPLGEIQGTVDNYGATLTDAGQGALITASASANVKGATTSCLAGASVTSDVYGIGITFCGGNASATVRRYLADLMIDPAGGTTWVALINNLYVNSPALTGGGYRYFFPLFLKAGTSVGLRTQSNVASATMRGAVQLYGKPTRSELIKVGSRVETFGAVTATTSGTAVTPGNAVAGAYVSLGTTANECWWWQWGGVGCNDTTQGLNALMGDVAAGDATNKKICADSITQNNTAAEQSGKEALGLRPPYRVIKAGETVYVRVSGSVLGDTTTDTTAYAVGG
jgi:hypothetical protein